MKKIILAAMCACILLQPVTAGAMTYEEERKLAQEVVTSLDAQGYLIYDQEVTWPVKMITERLADHVKNPVYTFTVHVVADRTINAFTIPDGHIFINVGTLLFARDMDEIAAVIGHEMGHAQLRHIPHSYEQQTEVTAASILGVILGAIAASKNPQAGAALIYSAIGGGENIRLAYSRRHEHDADDFGRQILASSGYDVSAMNRFLSRLGSVTGGKDIPEYLLTHPSTPNRISDIGSGSQQPHPDAYYWTLQASVIGLIMPTDEGLQRAQALPNPYRSLSLAIIDTNRGQNQKALDLLKGLDLPLANTYRGVNLAALGKKDEAYPLLKKYGGTEKAQMALAEIMEGRGEYDQAIQVLLPSQRTDIQIDYKLGLLYQKSKKETPSHVCFARYFFKTGKNRAAVFHADKALEDKKALDPGTVDELNNMKDYIKKIEAK